MNDDLTERVARAMCVAAGQNPDAWDAPRRVQKKADYVWSGWLDFVPAAKVAIAECRTEPPK